MKALSYRLWPILQTALAYAVAGGLALWLARPPGYAAPLYPAAGIALAAVMVRGRASLPAVFLGALLVNSLLGGPRDQSALVTLFCSLTVAVGATAQAALGARLLKTRLTPPQDLSEVRDALQLFTLGGAAACTLSATAGTLGLWAAGTLPTAAVPGNWLSWWTGDTLGVMLATPVTLTLIGHPRSLWARRRITVALPMVAVTAAVGLATALVSQGEDRRSQGVFERDVTHSTEALTSGLKQPLHALQAMHSLYLGSDRVTEADFRAASQAWREEAPSLAAIGFNVRVPRAALDSFTQQVQRDGLPTWRVFERVDAPASLTATDRDVVAMLRVEPQGPNVRALGVNVLSIPAARTAIERAVASGQAAATEGFRLTQSLTDETGVVIYRPVPAQAPNAIEPQGRPGGVVFVTLRTAEAARLLMAHAPAYLGWCLQDRSPGAQRLLLAGAADCARPARPGELSARQPIDFAGRQWELTLRAQVADLPREGRWNLAWFAISGLLSTAVLGALLLTLTGRSQRIEAAVDERTADLRREVAERRRIEQALRESEQRWRNIVDHIPIGVVYAELDGRIRETNPRLREMLGMEASALLTRRLADLGLPEDRAEDARLLRALVSGERPLVRRRQHLLRADGQRIWVQTLLSVLRDANGQPLRLTGVVEDITEHLKLAEAETARETAEAASRAKSEFLSRVSHELRTPLNAILGFGQLLGLDREPGLTPRQREWNDQVQQAGWHLLNLINEMLDLSRIEAGHLALELQTVDAAPLLSECLAMVGPAAEAQQLTLAPADVRCTRAVRADPTRLRQVLTNLLSNAVKYNRPGGSVRCRIEDGPDDTVQLQVADDGEGLTAEALGRLFQPFNRLGRERSGIEGTGLGLVISLRLAEAMGGRLDARSTPGQGSTFTLTLPASASQAPRAETALAPTPSEPGPAAAPRRVLYIEDNETNAEVMRGILARRPKLQLEVAMSGLDGLAAASARPPDLILLDMHLPDMDGLDVLRRLQLDPLLAGVAVLAVSADATPARLAQAQALGVTGYITKPVDVTGLLAQVDEALSATDAG